MIIFSSAATSNKSPGEVLGMKLRLRVGPWFGRNIATYKNSPSNFTLVTNKKISTSNSEFIPLNVFIICVDLFRSRSQQINGTIRRNRDVTELIPPLLRSVSIQEAVRFPPLYLPTGISIPTDITTP
jgi:hypothetical protein